MSLIDDIRAAQIRAGEDAVIKNLEGLGLRVSAEKLTATTSAANTSPVDLDAMARVMNELHGRQTQTDGKWTLISPDGKVYIGEPGELLSTLLADHPIFKGFPR